MNPTKTVNVKTRDDIEPLTIVSGTRIYDIIKKHPDAFPTREDGLFPVAATQNNELVALSDKITINSKIALIYPDSTIGADVYRRSLVFLLNMAWHKLYPNTRLEISHSIGYAFYFIIKDTERDAKENEASQKKV